MTREDFIKNHKIDPEALDWKQSENGLYRYAEVGPYWVTFVDVEGYRLIRNNSVVKWRIDLQEFTRG